MRVLVVVLIILLIVFLVNRCFGKDKGARGEAKVARVLKKSASKNSRLINDIVLLDSKKNSYQIDHIFINENGIWIIETKNWSGYIYGTDEQKEWTQVLAYGNEKHRHYSPVQQNLAHVFKLQERFTGNIPIIPLVVFVSANIKNVDSKFVCGIEELPHKVNTNQGVYLPEQVIEKCYNLIKAIQATCNITSKQHAKKQKRKQKMLKRGRCPCCCGVLQRRKGKYGDFYGCSRYPMCKFTKKINEN